MRTLLGIVTITLSASVVLAADVRDLGVPAGWRASDYDRHGYDLLNKDDYENARRYFDAAIRTDPYMWSVLQSCCNFLPAEKMDGSVTGSELNHPIKAQLFRCQFSTGWCKQQAR